ncbi:MAG: 16S rRNA (guanine(527)-N(7))-methyltransferase RsmG [Rhizobiaceae bacterium]|nr:16S rRNA (guanine(527)-N(7))-methyltransferase RsmG [Rhizobiaceae bacterium]
MSDFLPSPGDQKLLDSIVPVSRETMAKLQIYVDLLVEWQKKTNLVAQSTLQDVWRRHICDSAQCEAVGKVILPSGRNWLDLGSGAGFPGLVVAIVGCSDMRVQLVESNAKKCAFLRKVIRETGIDASVTNERIESVTKQFQDVEILTARALAPMRKLLDLSHSWLENGALGMFPKGQDYMGELEDCRGVWNFDLVIHNSRTNDNSVLLEIRNLKKPCR